MIARRTGLLAPGLAALVVAGCSMLPIPRPPASAQRDPNVTGPLVEALRAWRGGGIDSYRWQLDVACECVLNGPVEVTVVDGNVTRVRTPSGDVPFAQVQAFPLTVDTLLQRAIDADHAGGMVGASWSGANGVPDEVSIDPDPQAVDDELSVTVVRFDPGP